MSHIHVADVTATLEMNGKGNGSFSFIRIFLHEASIQGGSGRYGTIVDMLRIHF